MGRRREIEPGAAGFEREHEEWDVVVLLEPAHQLPSLPDFRLPMQNEAGATEHRTQKRRQRHRDFLKLRKHQRLFLPGRNHLDEVARSAELATVLLRPRIVAKPCEG